ncbi:transposase [Hymenobacter terricola]|uniref:transposase n=1 Tax=Hymenobacter terricola TaxID=2819236 RepID=UPI001CF275AE
MIEHNEEVYKNRNQIERCFNRLKRFRGLASRYEKNASTFLAMVTLGAILMWL